MRLPFVISLAVAMLTAATHAATSSETAVALTGEVDAARLRATIDLHPSLLRLDLSAATMTELPPFSLAATTIEELILPDGLTSIADGALAGSALRTLVIPPSVTSIGPYAFSGCTALEAIDGGSALRTIGEGAMRRCPALQSIPLPATLEAIGSSALRGSAITNADLRLCSALRTIGDWALAGCTSLETLTLPDGIESIGRGAFFGDTALRTITIGASLDSIADFAFAHDASLATVGATDLHSVPALGTTPWHGIDCHSATLSVLPAMVSDFAATPGWQDFTIISTSDTHTAPTHTPVAIAFIGQELTIDAPVGIRTVAVYTADGRLHLSAAPNATSCRLDATPLPHGAICIVALTLADGTLSATKLTPK